MSYMLCLVDWLEKLNNGFSKIGKPSRIVYLLKGYIEEVRFIDVHEEIYKVRRKEYYPGFCSLLLNSVRFHAVLRQRT